MFRSKTVLVAASLLLVPSYGCRQSPKVQTPFFFVDHIGGAEVEFDQDLFAFQKDGQLAAPVTIKDETQQSLTPPIPSRLGFVVHVPEEATLRYSIAVATLDESGIRPPIEFRLTVFRESGSEVVFSEVVGREKNDLWLDRELDLSPWAGQTIRLDFETKLRRPGARAARSTQHILPTWGDPVLVGTRQPDNRPNIFLISVDCLRADHVSAYGYARDTTPNIDDLAADGVLFETTVSNSSWTIPSHMSMFTGLLPSFHGATKERRLHDSFAYLPEILAAKGYHSSGVATWIYVSQLFGFERGFHAYKVLSDENTRADDVVDAGLELVRRAKDQQQFLFLHMLDPHAPYLPTRDFVERFGPRPKDISGLYDRIMKAGEPASDEDTEALIRLYDAEVAYSDRALGRFFRELKAMGLYDESLIILTADHGEAFFEHGHWQHTFSLYEEILRVPLIVKWPEPSPKRRVKDLVSLIDVFPTILEAAGLSQPTTNAVNLARYVDKSHGHPGSRMTFSEVGSWFPDGASLKISIRTEELKYMATASRPSGEELSSFLLRDEELYDLINDPNERRNLLADSPEDVKTFRRRANNLFEQAEHVRRNRLGEVVVLDEDVKQRLRSLGYLVN